MKSRSVALALLCLVISSEARAFCGFYVAKADASLYNKASQVVLVRNENKTAITMYSDYKGDLKDFALVIPVPEVLKREQINVNDRAILDRIDDFTAPRLVEYFDPDPCQELMLKRDMVPASMKKAEGGSGGMGGAGGFGVKIEAKYTVGEYDILILSAKESDGLEAWLVKEGYKLPKGSSKALAPYIKQDMKFFVAKVNLKEQAKGGFTYLRPLQFAFESPKYMLPIRLGMVNADGPQDMIVYAITKRGRVETTNYRTVKIPSDQEIPLFVKDKFADFYKSLFETTFKKENQRVVVQEYGWNMSWCDPCAAEPLRPEELSKLGVFWADSGAPQGKTTDAYVTRLHVRYDREHFAEDLFFQETADISTFQGRYVLNHPYAGPSSCPAMDNYRNSVEYRREKEAQNLAMLTGWKTEEIWKQMGGKGQPPAGPKKWYQNIFK